MPSDSAHDTDIIDSGKSGYNAEECTCKTEKHSRHNTNNMSKNTGMTVDSIEGFYLLSPTCALATFTNRCSTRHLTDVAVMAM